MGKQPSRCTTVRALLPLFSFYRYPNSVQSFEVRKRGENVGCSNVAVVSFSHSLWRFPFFFCTERQHQIHHPMGRRVFAEARQLANRGRRENTHRIRAYSQDAFERAQVGQLECAVPGCGWAHGQPASQICYTRFCSGTAFCGRGGRQAQSGQ